MGTNRANPAAMILSATMMLRHLGWVFFFTNTIMPSDLTLPTRLDSMADSIASSTLGVINNGQIRTADMGGKWPSQVFLHRITVVPGTASTSDFTAEVIKNL